MGASLGPLRDSFPVPVDRHLGCPVALIHLRKYRFNLSVIRLEIESTLPGTDSVWRGSPHRYHDSHCKYGQHGGLWLPKPLRWLALPIALGFLFRVALVGWAALAVYYSNLPWPLAAPGPGAEHFWRLVFGPYGGRAGRRMLLPSPECF